MTKDEMKSVILQATFRIWRRQKGTHDDWKSIRRIAKSQMLAVTDEVMAEIEPYLDLP